MPALLLTAWPFIKRFGPWIALVIAALAGWHAVAVHYREQGRAESAATIAGDQAAMQRGLDAIAALRGALDQKNAESLARAKAFADAENAAAKSDAASDRAWEATQKRMAALAQVKPGGCVAGTDVIIKAVEGL